MNPRIQLYQHEWKLEKQEIVWKHDACRATVQEIDSRFTQQCNVVFYVYADLFSLLAATSQFSFLIGQNMQLTGCRNGNEMRNATCAVTQISIEWPYCSFPILWQGGVFSLNFEFFQFPRVLI